MNSSAKPSRPKRRSDQPVQGFIPELNAKSDGAKKSLARANPKSPPPTESGTAVFCLKMPSAQTVKLAADFTGWEKKPLDLRPVGNGSWQLTVALPPGRYAYRYLVDGEWRDDPRCAQSEPNPFGTTNAVVQVR